jgi:hypothetical protein
MSKAKKNAYADKQKAAAVAAGARQLVPLGENAAPAVAKKAKSRKQSRGK